MSPDNINRGPGAKPPHCPRCAGQLARVHRRASDHWFASLRRGPVFRFQCRSVTCGWSGLLEPGPTPDIDRRRPLVAGALTVLFVAVAAVGLIAVTPDRRGPGSDAGSESAQGTVALRPLSQNAVVHVPPAGWHDVGQALPSDDARHAGSAAGLQIRHGCTWGVPGRDPYRGTAEQALQAAGLPADVVRVIAQRIRRGESDGEVRLARDGIQTADGQRQFGRRLVASTYGMTLCFDTLVNFEEGHVERAPLFEFTSADGQRFSVIVPDVCGNVGVISEPPLAGIVLGERAERAERATDPVAPGTSETPTSSGAPRLAGPVSVQTPFGAPRTMAGGGPDFPALAMGSGGNGPSPRGSASSKSTLLPTPPTVDPSPGPQSPRNGASTPAQDNALSQPTSPPTPVGPATPATAEPPLTSPKVVPGPTTQPSGSGSNPPPQGATPPQTTVPPTPAGPMPPITPLAPRTPPKVAPGPATQPPGNGSNPPPQGITPPQTTVPPPGNGSTPPGNGSTPPPQGTTPPQPMLPPRPGGPTPPATPFPAPPVTLLPALPETPPTPVDPPYLPPAILPPAVQELPPILPEPEPPRPVPAPGTLSTSVLALAALMLSRRWRRRRDG